MSSAVVLATAGYDHKIRFWEASREKCTRVLRYLDSQVNALSITNDKQYIAAVGNPHAKIFQVHHGEDNPLCSYEAHSGNVTCVGFQCDAKWMYTGSEDKLIRIWDLRAKRHQREYACTAGVTSVALHPNQMELVSGDQDGTVRVWDLRANECSQTMTPSDGTHEGAAGHGTLGESAVAIRSVSMSSDASLVVAGNNAGRVFCWRPHSSSGGGGGGGDDAAANTSAAAGGSAFTPIASGGAGGGGGSGYGYRPLGVTNTMHDGYLLKCVISPDVNRLVTCSADKTVKIWNINTQRLNAFLEDEDDDDDDDEDDDEEDDAADKNAAEGEDEDEDGGGGEGGRNGEGEDGEQSNGASAASSSSSSSSSAEDSSASSSSSSSSSSTSPSNAPPPVPSKAGLRTPPPPANAASSSSSSSSSGSGGGSGGSGGSGGVVAFPRAPHSSGLGFGPGSMVGGLTLERNLAQHQRWVWDACFSADSAYLVTASSDQTAKLWDVQTGEVIRHYTSQMAITCVALNDASS